MDNNTRKELLYKARAAGYPGSILDVFAAYSQGKDLIAEYQQEQRMQQAQQMSDFVGAQTLQQPQAQPQFQPQVPQVPSSPPSVQANVPLNVQPANTELVDSSKQTNVGIVPNQTGSYKGRAIFAKGGFKTDPPLLPPMNTLNPVEVKRNRFDTTSYPNLGITQSLPNFRPIRNSTLQEEIYWNQVPDFYKQWGKDDITEDVLEFIDPTGVLSHDDAKRAYRSWKESGRKDPTPEEGLEMFGAVPALGKFGKIKYVKQGVKPVNKYIPWQQILNAIGLGKDMSEHSNENKKEGGFKGMGPGCPDGYFKDINGNCIPLLKPIEEGVDGFEGQDLAQYYRSFPAQNRLCKEPGCFNYEAGKTGYQKNPMHLSTQLAYAGSGIANSKDYVKSYKPSDDDEILRNKYVEQSSDPTKNVPGPFFGSTINIETDEERKERAKTVNPDKVRKDFYTRLEDRFVNNVSNFYKFSEYGEQPILSYEDLNKVSEGYLDEFLSDPNISEEAKQKVINTIGQDSYKQYINTKYTIIPPALPYESKNPILTKYSPDMEEAVPVTGAIKTGFLDNKKKKKLGGVKDKCYTCQKIHKVKK